MEEPGAYAVTLPHMTYQKEVRYYNNTTSTPSASDFESWLAKSRFPGIWKLGDGSFYDHTHSGQASLVIVMNFTADKDAQPAMA